MIEVGAVIAKDHRVLYWHVPAGATAGSLPDSRELWDVLWEHRDEIAGFAHVHPWIGDAAPSSIDLSTFAAVELGLGRPLSWWIVTFTDVARVERDPDAEAYAVTAGYVAVRRPPELMLSWVEPLRDLAKGHMPKIGVLQTAPWETADESKKEEK